MSRTQPERLWIAGGAVGALVIAGASWLFAVHPKLSDVDSLHSQTQDTKAQNLSLQEDVGRLQAAYAHIGTLRSARDAARAALPADNSLSALTQQLGRQALSAHVSVGLLTIGNPAPATPAASTSAAAPAPAPSSSAAPAAPAAPAVPGAAAPSGLYSIPVTVMVTGSANNDVRFLDAVQHQGPRAVLIGSAQFAVATNSTSGGATTSGGVALTVNMQAFVAPQAPVAAPTTAPAAAPAPQ